MTTLIVVPARGGSTGLPRKNLAPVGGLSLVARAVLAGRQFIADVGLPPTPILVDTDSPEIADEGRHWDAVVPFLRPSELARDVTPTHENVLLAIERMTASHGPIDTIVLLQPTSPLRTSDDIAQCWSAYDLTEHPSIISVVRSPHGGGLALTMEDHGVVRWATERPAQSTRRQDATPVFYPNGAVYVIAVDLLRRTRAFIIPGVTRGVEMPSIRSIDIDRAEDLQSADSLHEATLDASLALGRHRAGGKRRCLIFAQLTIPDPNDASAGVEQVDAVATAGVDAIVVPLPRTTSPQGLHDGFAAACRRSAARGLETIGIAESPDAILDPQCAAWGARISQEEDIASLASRVSPARRPLLLMPERVPLTTLVNVVAKLRRVGVANLGLLTGGSAPGDSLQLEAQAARFALRAVVGWSAEDFEGALAAVAANADFVVLRLALESRFQHPATSTALDLVQVGIVTKFARKVAPLRSWEV